MLPKCSIVLTKINYSIVGDANRNVGSIKESLTSSNVATSEDYFSADEDIIVVDSDDEQSSKSRNTLFFKRKLTFDDSVSPSSSKKALLLEIDSSEDEDDRDNNDSIEDDDDDFSDNDSSDDLSIACTSRTRIPVNLDISDSSSSEKSCNSDSLSEVESDELDKGFIFKVSTSVPRTRQIVGDVSSRTNLPAADSDNPLDTGIYECEEKIRSVLHKQMTYFRKLKQSTRELKMLRKTIPMSVWRKYKNLEEIELEIRAEIEEFENKYQKELRELEEKHEIMRIMAQLGMKRNYRYNSGKGTRGRKRCRSTTSPSGLRRKLYTCPIYLCPGSFDNIERHAKSAHANYSVTNEDLQFFVERTKRIHGLKAQTTAINDLYLPPTKKVLQKEAKKGQEVAKQKAELNLPSASSNKQRTMHVKGQRKELADKGRYGMVREILNNKSSRQEVNAIEKTDIRGKEMKRHLNTEEEQVKLTETIDQVDRNGHLKNLIDEFDRHIQRTKAHKYQARGLFRRFLLSFSPIYENFLYDNILRQIDKIESLAKFSKKYKVLGFNSQRKLVTVIKQFLTFCDHHTNLSADLITHSEINHLQQVLQPYDKILKKKEVIERGISQHPKCNTESFKMEDIVNFSDREVVMNVLRWAAKFETGEIARKLYTLKKTLLLRSVLLTTLTLSTGRRALEGMSLTAGFAMHCIRLWEGEIKEDPEAILKIPLAAQQKTSKPGMTGNYFAHGTFARAFRSYLFYILPIYLDRPVKNTDYVFCSPFGNMIPFKAFNKMLCEGWMLAYPSYKGPLLTSRLIREKMESEIAVRNPEIISEVQFMKSHPVERYTHHDTTKWLETDLKTYLTLRQIYAWDSEMEIEQEEETCREKGTDTKNGEETEEDTDREKEVEEEERRTREKEVQEQCDDESREGSCGEVESVGEQDYKEYEGREVSLGEVESVGEQDYKEYEGREVSLGEVESVGEQDYKEYEGREVSLGEVELVGEQDYKEYEGREVSLGAVEVVRGKNRVEGKERKGSSVLKERDGKHIDNKEMLRRIYFKYQNDRKKNNTKFSISEFRKNIPKSCTYFRSNRYRLKKLFKQFENE